MRELIFGGVAGLLLGLSMRSAGLTEPQSLRRAAALRHGPTLRMLLAFAGYGALLTAFLGWLAVLDVDLLNVSPLRWVTLLGGLLTGAGVAVCGLLPGTAVGGIGGGRWTVSLCAVAGGLVGALMLPFAARWLEPIAGPVWSQHTFFRVTLDAPYLFPGSFLGLGVAGLALLAVALVMPRPRPAEEREKALRPIPDVAPEQAVQDSVVASLPNEEPMVIDTAEPALDESDDELIAEADIPEEWPENPDAEAPVMVDHPALDEAPDSVDTTEALVELEERAGIGTYLAEEAMPAGARVLVRPDAEVEAETVEKDDAREPVGKA